MKRRMKTRQKLFDSIWRNFCGKVLESSRREEIDPASYAQGREDGCSGIRMPDDPWKIVSCGASYTMGHIDGMIEGRKNKILNVKL